MECRKCHEVSLGDSCQDCGLRRDADFLKRDADLTQRVYKHCRGEGKGIRCSHGCGDCEEMRRSYSPDNMRCPSCGHTSFHPSLNIHHCTSCDANSWICSGCQTGAFGAGEYCRSWYCTFCWADWKNQHCEDTIVQVTGMPPSCSDADVVHVSCLYALSGNQIVDAEVVRHGGLRLLRNVLRKRLLGDPRRMARNGFAYSQAEFEEYYRRFGHEVYENRWAEAPPVWTTDVQLLVGDEVVSEADELDLVLTALPDGELLVATAATAAAAMASAVASPPPGPASSTACGRRGMAPAAACTAAKALGTSPAMHSDERKTAAPAAKPRGARHGDDDDGRVALTPAARGGGGGTRIAGL